METATLIEYSHRLSAALVGALVLATTVIAWRVYRSDRRVTLGSAGALGLVLAAAVLGGLTVRTELAWWFVMVHLAVAEALVALLVLVAVVARKPDGEDTRSRPTELGRSDVLLISALAGTFALILSGSYMVGLGYGSACATWPLCRGSVVPAGEASFVHMAHRYVAAIVGVLVVWSAVAVSLRRGARLELKLAAGVLAGAFAAQVIVGAAVVWTEFSAQLKGMHLTTATLTWAALAYLASLNFAGRLRAQGARRPAPIMSGLPRTAQ
jgi:cytochrome c oxidase assembly protein subunit 15